MNSQTTLSITDARKDLFRIVDRAVKTSKYYTLTEKGRPKVVLMSADEFESWVETLDVMREFPTLLHDWKRAEQDHRNGRLMSYEEFLNKEGLVLRSDSQRKKQKKQ